MYHISGICTHTHVHAYVLSWAERQRVDRDACVPGRGYAAMCCRPVLAPGVERRVWSVQTVFLPRPAAARGAAAWHDTPRTASRRGVDAHLLLLRGSRTPPLPSAAVCVQLTRVDILTRETRSKHDSVVVRMTALEDSVTTSTKVPIYMV